MSCDLFVFAGEKSGDLHGEKLLQALKAQHPDLKIAGVGGPRMRAQGMQTVLRMEDFQVMGFIDVFKALPKLIRQFYFVAREILRLKPKAVVTIDYPGFNLRLAKHLKKKGFGGKIIHFICPSVWAWGKKRIPLMAENLDALLCILPFEKKIFSATPLPTTYVGHPLVERLHAYAYSTPPAQEKTIALFPGSRRKEIERNLPRYLDVCRELLKEQPLRIALSVSEEKFRPLILDILRAKQFTDAILVPSDGSYELMQSAHMAIAKSGTVTLELALHRVPTVVTYGITFLDEIIAYHILRIRLPFYCLVNIIAGKQIFAELYGSRFTTESLLAEARKLLDPAHRAGMQQACGELIDILGSQSASETAAKEVLNLAFNSSSP